MAALKTLGSPDADTGSSSMVFGANWNDSVYHIKRIPTSKVIVSVQGSDYVAQKADGTELYNDTNAETCISTALAQTGHIHITDGNYTLPPTFAGFSLSSSTQLTLDRLAQIIIPNAFAGNVFTLTSPVTQSSIEGGYFFEAGTPARNWTWLQLYGHNSGVYFNRFSDSKVYDCNRGVDFFGDTTTSWCNSNHFDFLKIYNPNIGFDFRFTASWTADGSMGFIQNHFDNCAVQVISGNTLYGFKNIAHWRNVFVNCYCWDPAIGTATATIDTNAQDNIIVGGNLGQQNYVDNSTDKSTVIIDPYKAHTIGDNALKFTAGAIVDDGSAIIRFRTANLANPYDIACQSVWVSANSKISVNGTQWVYWDNTNTRIEFDKPLYFASGVNIKAKSSSVAPTATDIAAGEFIVWKNTGDGTVKLYYNDGGSLKSTTLA